MTDLELPVELYGTHLGELVRTRGGLALFRWSADAEERWGINSPVLSQKILVGSSNVEASESFFGALLPEGEHLGALAREAQVDRADLVGLLAAVGADLAGALRVADTLRHSEPQVLTTDGLVQLLNRADGFLLGGGGSALPGFQRKLALSRVDGQWVRGNGTLPSTHILKPVGADGMPAVQAEHYTLGVARRLGLASFDSFVQTIGDRHVLVVERYDRRHVGGEVTRLHQEDAGQALGLPWGGAEKFETNDSRASLAGVASLLDRQRSAFARGESDRERLLRYATLNVAVGNTDAHAKNFSLLHAPDGFVTLAPYYDAAPLALAYDAGSALSMRINGVWQQPDITTRDLVEEARTWGVAAERARAIVDDTLERTVEATRTLEAHESIEAHVPGYIRAQALNLLERRAARVVSPLPLMLSKRIGTPQPRTHP